MSKAPDAWTTPAPLKGDEFQVWLHTDKAERMYRREEAVLFVSHKDLDRIDCREVEEHGEGNLRNVTEELCIDWMNMQSHYLAPRFIPSSVKQHVTDWAEINDAKRVRQLEAAE